MTSRIPFTAAAVARAIKGAVQAGLFVVGVRPDGTVIVADKPFDTASLVPEIEQPSPPVPKSWRERLGGQGET
jgi:hypothetical protein